MSCTQDASFGPSLVMGSNDCHGFDFTLAFEHGILQILPSTLFVVLSVARILSVYKDPKIVAYSRTQVCKSVSR